MSSGEATQAALWHRLAQVRHVEFASSGKAGTGWNGRGTGRVTTTCVDRDVLVYAEAGEWVPEVGTPSRFRNVFRWTRVPGGIRLEHLRLGEDSPAYLFDLVPDTTTQWRSRDVHVCGPDCYSAVLTVAAGELWLRWKVAGPRKGATIEYRYR
jgi:hypothetical protein